MEYLTKTAEVGEVALRVKIAPQRKCERVVMKGKAKYIVALLLIAIGVGAFYACFPPKILAHRLRSADRLVATNIGTSAKFSVTGEEARKIARVVASAKRDWHNYYAMFDWHIQFYSGSNFVASIRMQDRVFRMGGTQFSNETGTLKAFYLGPLLDANRKATQDAVDLPAR